MAGYALKLRNCGSWAGVIVRGNAPFHRSYWLIARGAIHPPGHGRRSAQVPIITANNHSYSNGRHTLIAPLLQTRWQPLDALLVCAATFSPNEVPPSRAALPSSLAALPPSPACWVYWSKCTAKDVGPSSLYQSTPLAVWRGRTHCNRV